MTIVPYSRPEVSADIRGFPNGSIPPCHMEKNLPPRHRGDSANLLMTDDLPGHQGPGTAAWLNRPQRLHRPADVRVMVLGDKSMVDRVCL